MPNVGDNRPSGSVQDDLVFEDISPIVADAARSGEILRIAPHVERLEKTYGESGLSRGRIADELILAASEAKVPAEMDRTS